MPSIIFFPSYAHCKTFSTTLSIFFFIALLLFLFRCAFIRRLNRGLLSTIYKQAIYNNSSFIILYTLCCTLSYSQFSSRIRKKYEFNLFLETQVLLSWLLFSSKKFGKKICVMSIIFSKTFTKFLNVSNSPSFCK